MKPDISDEALEAEVNVLGCALRSPLAVLEVARVLGPEHFWDEFHGAVFRAALEAAEVGASLTVWALWEAVMCEPNADCYGPEQIDDALRVANTDALADDFITMLSEAMDRGVAPYWTKAVQ